MNSSDFIRLLSADHYSPADLSEVRDLCRHYPMFNLAHMLEVRIKEALGQDKEKALKRAAVYSGDRRRFYEFVHEVSTLPEPGKELQEESSEIRFSDEPQQQVDVIIEQHAPYAGAGSGPDPLLLELDEEKSEEGKKEEEGEEDEDNQEEEISSETIVGAFMKDETEMEEPEVEHPQETPAIDLVEKEKDSDSDSLIKNFISEDPGPIRPDRETGLKGDVSLASIREHDGLITDTLARIYVKQGLYAKAIYAYEKLSLKYPEKSAYFAAQIDKIKDINNSS